MRRNLHTIAAALFSGLVVSAIPNDASAWLTNECNGQVEGIRFMRTFKLLRCSIPAGHPREGAVLHAMNEWNRLVGVGDRFASQSGTSACVAVDHDNGQWEVAFVDTASIDGSSGLAVMDIEPCVWPFPGGLNGVVTEADVMIASNLPEGILGELSTTLGARETAIHEFGHVLGMQHVDNLMTVMCTSNTCGKFGGSDASGAGFTANTESLHPDDVHFAAQWHGEAGGAIDVAASGWTLAGTTHQLTHPTLSTFTRCPGQTVSVTFSHAIKGKNNVLSTNPMAARIVFSTNDIISALDVTGSSFTVFGNRGAFFTNTVTVTVPNLAAGTYRIGLVVDPTNSFAETEERNNGSLVNRRIIVPSGC